MEPEITPAPAPVATEIPTPDLTPAEAAVSTNDFTAFKKARHEERFPSKEVKPKVATPTTEPIAPEPPKAAAVETPERITSKRQDDLNERIRTSVDRATAHLTAEITRLRAQIDPPPVVKPTVATVTSDDPEPDPTNAEKYPDGQFDRAYFKDLTAWQTRTALREHDQQRATEQQQSHAIQSFRTRADSQKTKIAAAVTADPKALEGIDPQLAELRPSIDLRPDEPHTFGNAIADWLIDTAYPVELLHHLSDRAEAVRLSHLSSVELLREQGRIEARFANNATPAAAPAPAKAPTLTQAPEPPQTLGRKPADTPDPIDSALRDGDFAAYQRAKRQKGVLHYAG